MTGALLFGFGVFAAPFAAGFVITARRLNARRRPVPPLSGHGWRGDDGD